MKNFNMNELFNFTSWNMSVDMLTEKSSSLASGSSSFKSTQNPSESSSKSLILNQMNSMELNFLPVNSSLNMTTMTSNSSSYYLKDLNMTENIIEYNNSRLDKNDSPRPTNASLSRLNVLNISKKNKNETDIKLSDNNPRPTSTATTTESLNKTRKNFFFGWLNMTRSNSSNEAIKVDSTKDQSSDKNASLPWFGLFRPKNSSTIIENNNNAGNNITETNKNQSNPFSLLKFFQKNSTTITTTEDITTSSQDKNSNSTKISLPFVSIFLPKKNLTSNLSNSTKLSNKIRKSNEKSRKILKSNTTITMKGSTELNKNSSNNIIIDNIMNTTINMWNNVASLKWIPFLNENITVSNNTNSSFPNLFKKQPSIPARLVIGAENDFIVDIEGVNETARYFGIDPIIVPDVYHDVMLGSKWESTARILADWIKSL
jgi:hypothetical protein